MSEQAGFLDKERIIAGPGFNRWLVPPAALAIKCGPEGGYFAQLFTTTSDWQISILGWMYTLFFVLGGVLYFSVPSSADVD
ncbi:MAG: hypothetical protein RL459_1951 [Pseudomonadota bacterium]|jgi:hypothetical protein